MIHYINNLFINQKSCVVKRAFHYQLHYSDVDQWYKALQESVIVQMTT